MILSAQPLHWKEIAQEYCLGCMKETLEMLDEIPKEQKKKNWFNLNNHDDCSSNECTNKF